MRFLIIILLFFTNICESHSQDPNHFVIGAKEFAKSNIYTLLYDDDTDILYVGTSSGLYAFVQNTFVQLKREKIVNGAFFNLQKGKNGEIFCSTVDGLIFKIENLKIKLFADVPKKLILNRFDFFVANDGNILAACNDLIKINADGKQETLIKGKRSSILVKQLFSGGIIITYQDTSFNKLYSYEKDEMKIIKKGEISLPLNINNENLYFHYFTLNNKLFYADNNSNFFDRNNKIKTNVNCKPFQNIRSLSKNEAIFLSKTKGAKILSLNNDSLFIKQTLFNDEFLSSETQNKNGTLFFGTFGEGIKVVPDLNAVSYISKELFLGIATSPENNAFISTRSGKILNAKNFKVLNTHTSNIDRVFYAKDFNKDNLLSQHNLGYLSSLKDVSKIDSSLFLVAGSNGIGVIAKDKKHPLLKSLKYYIEPKPNQYRVFPKAERTNTVLFSKIDTLIYYSQGVGVFSKKWKNDERNEILFKGNTISCNQMINYKNKILYATIGTGILVYNKNKFIESITTKNGLYSNIIFKIEVKNNILYILSKKGFQIYNLATKKFKQISILEDINQNIITNFAVSNNKIHFIERHKYFAISFENLSSKAKIQKLYFDSIIVNNSVIDPLKKNIFNHNENRFNFYFDYRDIETKYETKIHYKLEGFHNDWKQIPSTENQILFQSLPIGEYVFHIKAVFRNQEAKTYDYKFEISAPFWQKWWFYLFIIISSGLIVFTVLFFHNKRKEIKAKHILKNEILKKDLAQSNLKAIRSQMNPHFIFNSLNSIQDLVLKQDTDKSYDYIVLFADLVRSSLNYSEKEFISIGKEIEFQKIYLQLEKLRFGEDLQFEVNYSGSWDVQIPSLVVQPFIENALLHGLLHKEGIKKIIITFEVNEQLICTITDNGIGRTKAKEIKDRQKGSHSSFSTNAIKKRMEILSNQYNMEARFDYEDITKEGKVNGTKVRIILPFKLF